MISLIIKCCAGSVVSSRCVREHPASWFTKSVMYSQKLFVCPSQFPLTVPPKIATAQTEETKPSTHPPRPAPASIYGSGGCSCGLELALALHSRCIAPLPRVRRHPKSINSDQTFPFAPCCSPRYISFPLLISLQGWNGQEPSLWLRFVRLGVGYVRW